MSNKNAAAAHIAGWNAQTEFCGEYTHAGSRWALNFFAVDEADALAKLESIKATAVLLGRLDSRIDAGPDTQEGSHA